MAGKDVQKYKHNKPWYVVQHPGKPTAKHTKLVSLPLDYLLTLPGMRDEHKVLTFETPKVRKMVDICSDREWQRNNPVTLNVLADGRVIVEDGNHRIRAAKLGGCKTFLCKVVYYGGGEEHFDLAGILDKYAGITIGEYMLVVADFQGISGDGEVDGESADGDYAEQHDSGLNYGGENDPNKDDERTMIPGQTDGTRAALEALDGFVKYARLLTIDEMREQGRKAIEADPELQRLVEIYNSKRHAAMEPGVPAAPTAPAAPATPQKPGFWERLKPHHQKIIHTLINQLYTPGYDDVNPDDNNPWNLEPGQRLANLFRAALASDEVLEALVKIAESTNYPCPSCGSTTRPCSCMDGSEMSPAHTRDGNQRQRNPVKPKSSLPKEMNPNKGLGKL